MRLLMLQVIWPSVWLLLVCRGWCVCVRMLLRELLLLLLRKLLLLRLLLVSLLSGMAELLLRWIIRERLLLESCRWRILLVVCASCSFAFSRAGRVLRWR